MTKHYNKTARDVPPLSENDTVRVRENGSWKPALVIAKYNI